MEPNELVLNVNKKRLAKKSSKTCGQGRSKYLPNKVVYESGCSGINRQNLRKN